MPTYLDKFDVGWNIGEFTIKREITGFEEMPVPGQAGKGVKAVHGVGDDAAIPAAPVGGQ